MIASRRSHRPNSFAARELSRPRRAAWKTRGCVSVTTAWGSATTLPYCSFGNAKQIAHRRIRGFKQRIGRIDLDRACNRAHRSRMSGLPRRGHELIQKVAHTPKTCGAGTTLQPRDVVGMERYGYRLFRHHMFIRYRHSFVESTIPADGDTIFVWVRIHSQPSLGREILPTPLLGPEAGLSDRRFARGATLAPGDQSRCSVDLGSGSLERSHGDADLFASLIPIGCPGNYDWPHCLW